MRSMKAGAFTPAILRSEPAVPHIALALNEGGGFHPRNPRLQIGAMGAALHRSMKAGAFTPAIPPYVGCPHMAMPRSMKAEAFTPAIRSHVV